MDLHSHGYYSEAFKDGIPKEAAAWLSVRESCVSVTEALLLRRFYDGKPTVFASVETEGA